ncbi:MAG: Ig-like domain-containing protein [Polyangiaceae bacterium]
MFVIPACSGFEHDCFETRTCSGPKGFIEAGPNDDWWETGAGAGGDLGVGFPMPVVASPSNSAGSAGSDEEATVDAALPRILEVTPADGATGVGSDTTIVIRFAQPMNSEATEAAYRSSDLPATGVSFTWSDGFTQLTLTPRAALDYAEGSAAFPAKMYHYSFDGSARDRNGQTLPAAPFAFSTLRQVSLELLPDPERTGTWTDGEGEGIHNCVRAATAPYQPTVCVGDDANNVRYSGFLSFDLSALPGTIRAFSSARLHASGMAYGVLEALGDNHLEHIVFEQLGDAALHTAALSALGPFYSGPSLMNATRLVLSYDLTSAVQDDYGNRVARAQRSQYRLGFAKIVADGSWDDLELPTSAIRLALTYLVP